MTATYDRARVPCDAQHGGGPIESSSKAGGRAARPRRPHTAAAESAPLVTPDRQNLGHIKFVNIDQQTTMLLSDGLTAHLALDLIPGCAIAERTDSDNTENRPRAWPDDGDRGKAPGKSISGDACRRPRRPSDAALAGTAEYLATRGTTSNDRPAVADRHARADAATYGFDTYCAELHGCTENQTSTLQNDTKRYTSEINNFINGKHQPATFPSINAIVNGADDRGGTPTADNDDGNRLTTTDDTEVTIQTQHTDKDLAYMIDYLQRGILPDDNKTARRVLLTKDNFAIRDGKLIHLGVKRQKNNGTEQPIAEQLCIPKQLQPTLLARYHAQLMHCGYEKMYLTLKQRVYWQNMYSDVRDYVAPVSYTHLTLPTIYSV